MSEQIRASSKSEHEGEQPPAWVNLPWPLFIYGSHRGVNWTPMKPLYLSETAFGAACRTGTPALAPLPTRNFTTVSYPKSLAASSAVRPSALVALTSTP